MGKLRRSEGRAKLGLPQEQSPQGLDPCNTLNKIRCLIWLGFKDRVFAILAETYYISQAEESQAGEVNSQLTQNEIFNLSLIPST